MKPEEVHQFMDLYNRYPRLLTLQGKIQTIIFPVLSSESLAGQGLNFVYIPPKIFPDSLAAAQIEKLIEKQANFFTLHSCR